MKTTRYEMIIQALQPIVHTQETQGNEAVFARKGVRQRSGDYVDVPFISGNSLRHKLREAAAYGTLHAAGILDDPQLSAGATRLLFNGGMVTGKGDAAVVNLTKWRQLAALFPPLALFGGCIDNGPRQGKVYVDEADVICREQSEYLPPWVHAWLESEGASLKGCAESVETRQEVRMDALLHDPTVRQLLAPNDRANVEARELVRDSAHEAKDAKAKKEAKSDMLPYSFERIKEGTLFLWGVQANTHTDLEWDAFNFSIACLLNNFRAGGVGRSGHGRLRFVAGSRIHFLPTAGTVESVGSDLAPKTGDIYMAHVAQRKDDLVEWLRSNLNA